MKDVKFRAWNSVDKMFIEWSTLKASPVLFMNILKSKIKHTELAQFTGLKDENGVEIYEGDIVKCTYMLWPDNKVFSEIKLAEIDCVNLDGDCGGGCDYEERLISLEVIGNIYQNPELLEEK